MTSATRRQGTGSRGSREELNHTIPQCFLQGRVARKLHLKTCSFFCNPPTDPPPNQNAQQALKKWCNKVLSEYKSHVPAINLLAREALSGFLFCPSNRSNAAKRAICFSQLSAQIDLHLPGFVNHVWRKCAFSNPALDYYVNC